MKMLEEKKTRFMDLLKQGEMVFAPCIWDCYSAKAAEMSGFKAALLAGTPAAASLTGTPDLGIMTGDELIYLTERVASFSSIPMPCRAARARTMSWYSLGVGAL